MWRMSTQPPPRSDLDQPLVIPATAYISPEYARLEQERLWRKVWLQAGREEDLVGPGAFITFDIGPDGVVIVRQQDGSLKAFHNVCPHRGRRLVDVPAGQRNAQGTLRNFVCGYHGWTFAPSGENTYVPHAEDWNGGLCAGRADLGEVRVGTWGGWVWISLDPDGGSLEDYLGIVPAMLDPYRLHDMRARWRKWIVFECNWKVAMEAFCETYHVATTHPEFNEFGQFRGWARNQGLHSHIGYEAPSNMEEDAGKLRVGTGDARISTAEMQRFTWENANTNTTLTMVEAAERLVEELPEGTPPAEVSAHWIRSAREADARRGVIWPAVEPAHTGKAGTAWQVFPNFQIGQGVNNMLCYAARPHGADPDKCIFEAAVYELFPEGQSPETAWEYTEPHQWPPVLQQDFGNMAAVQLGLKSAGFRGAQPNPYMERAVASLHANLARYMGMGEPQRRGGEG